MNPVLREILDTGVVRDADGRTFKVHSQIPPGEGAFLERLVRAERPRRSLEIGLAYGISTMHLLDALAEVGAERHWTIDPLQHGHLADKGDYEYAEADWSEYEWSPTTGWRGIGLLNIERAGHAALVEHIEEPSHLALSRLIRDEVEVDMAFIDGWHTFDYVLMDFMLVDMILRTGGVVVFDDADNPAIRKVLRYVLANRRYEVLDEHRVTPQPTRRRRRAALAALDRLGSPMRAISSEWLMRDSDLGLPDQRFVALRKTGPDILGDGSGDTRRWNDHHDF